MKRCPWRVVGSLGLGLAVFCGAGCRSTGLSGPIPATSGSQRLAEVADRNLQAGAPEEAVRFYRAALNAAQAADDTAGIVRAAAGLSVSLAAAGRLSDAMIMAGLARSESAPATAGRWTAELLQARLAWLDGDLDTAARLAENVLVAPGSGAYPWLRAEAGILAAEVAMRRDDPDVAAALLRAAERLLDATAPFSLRATRFVADGRLALLRERYADAAQAFDRAAELWRDAGRYREMALTLETAGDACLAAERRRDAADRYLRGGRSLLAAGAPVTAGRLLEKARAAAAELADGELMARIDLVIDAAGDSDSDTRP